MSASSTDTREILAASAATFTDDENAILTTLFAKLASNTRTDIQDKKFKDLPLAFWWAEQTFNSRIVIVCETYIKNASLLSGNFHTKTDMAEGMIKYFKTKVQEQRGRRPESSNEIVEVVTFIERMVALYWRLDHNPNTFRNLISSWSGESPCRIVDDITDDSTLFAYIRYTINFTMHEINFDPKRRHALFDNPKQLLIFIHLIALNRMYINRDSETVVFQMLYYLSMKHMLNAQYQQLIGASYKAAITSLAIVEPNTVLKSINTLNDFIALRLLIAIPGAKWRMHFFVDNMVDVFSDARAPMMLDIFDCLALEHYQRLLETLLQKYKNAPHTLSAIFGQAYFWQALLSRGAVLIASHSDADVKTTLGDLISQLIYHNTGDLATLLCHKDMVKTVWTLVLDKPDLHVWLQSLLCFPAPSQVSAPTTSSDRSSPVVCQSLERALPPSQQQAFFNELLGTLSSGSVNSLLQRLASPLVLTSLNDATMITLGTLLLEAQSKHYITAAAIRSVDSFVSRWTLQLVLAGYYPQVSQLVLQGIITWDVLIPLIQEKNLLGAPGERSPELIFGLLYVKTQQSSLTPQSIFNRMVALLWSDNRYADDRTWLVNEPLSAAPVMTASSSETQGHVDIDYSVVSYICEQYDDVAKQAFYAWWDEHKDDEQVMQRVDAKLSWMIGLLVIQRCNQAYPDTQDPNLLLSQTFWRHLQANGDISGNLAVMPKLLLQIEEFEARRKTLTDHYIKIDGTDVNFVEVMLANLEDENARFKAAEIIQLQFGVSNENIDFNEVVCLFLLFSNDRRSRYFIEIKENFNQLFNAIMAFEQSDTSIDDDSLVEDAWRSLFNAVTAEQLVALFDDHTNDREKCYAKLVDKKCEIGLRIALETMQLHFGADMWQQRPSFNDVLALSIQGRVEESMFTTLLSFVDLEVLTRQVICHGWTRPVSPLQMAPWIDTEQGFTYLTLMFERYRLLHGDTDLMASPRDEIIRGFVYAYAQPQFESRTRKSNLLQFAKQRGDLRRAMWLFNLTRTIWTEVLFAGSVFVPCNVDINHIAVIKVLNTAKSSQDEAITAAMIMQLVQTEHPSLTAFIDYIKQEPLPFSADLATVHTTILRFTVQADTALAAIDIHKAQTLLNTAERLSQSWREVLFIAARHQQAGDATSVISAKALFSFIAAIRQELKQRTQPLDLWIAQLAHLPALWQDIVQQLVQQETADISSSQSLRQTIASLVADPKGLSQQGQARLQQILVEADAISSESASSVEVSTAASNWASRLNHLVSDARALQSRQPIEALRQSAGALQDASTSQQLTACSLALYSRSSSGSSPSPSSSTGPSTQLKT